MITNVQNANEEPIKIFNDKCITDCGANKPSDIRVDPFAYYTNDPPDLCGDFNPPDYYVHRDSIGYFSTREKPGHPDYKSVLNCDKAKDESSLDEIVTMIKNNPLESKEIYLCDYCAEFEDALFKQVELLVWWDIMDQDFPDCEFKIDIDPVDWLTLSCLRLLKTVARLLYTVFECECMAIGRNGQFYRFSIEQYLPVAHCDEAVALLVDKRTWDSYVYQGEELLENEKSAIEKMERYLLEAAYYYIWNVRISKGDKPSNMTELFKGFNVPNEVEGRYWRFG